MVLTDMAEVVPLLQLNLALNQSLLQDQHCRRLLLHAYSARALQWGSTLGDVWGEGPESADGTGGPGRRLVVASAVVYDPAGYDPLVLSLTQLLQGYGAPDERPLCVLAHRHRHPEDSR